MTNEKKEILVIGDRAYTTTVESINRGMNDYRLVLPPVISSSAEKNVESALSAGNTKAF